MSCINRAFAIFLSLSVGMPVSAQDGGVWVNSLEPLRYEDRTAVGGYWDAGLDFNITLDCSPAHPYLNVQFGMPGTAPATIDGAYVFMRLGARDFIFDWADDFDANGFPHLFPDTNDTRQRWYGQEDFIQLLQDGYALQIYLARNRDFSDATLLRQAGSGSQEPMFANLSQICGHGADLTFDSEMPAAPQPNPSIEPAWAVVTGSAFWAAPTAIAHEDQDRAQAMVTCGGDGQAMLALAIEGVTPDADITFGSAFVDHQPFQLTWGRWQGMYVSNPGPEFLVALAGGLRVNFDGMTPRGIVLGFDLSGNQTAISQALQPCAITAMP